MIKMCSSIVMVSSFEMVVRLVYPLSIAQKLITSYIVAALCEAERVSSSHGTYSWPVTVAEDSMSIACQYGAANFPSVTLAVARRYCDPRGEWRESNTSECATFTDSTIRNISDVRMCNVINQVLTLISSCSFH